jgi:hypothetical protein
MGLIWNFSSHMKRRYRLFEKMVLWRIYGSKRDKVTGGYCTMSFVIFALPQTVFRKSDQV